METLPTFGPFRLQRPLDKGGMGIVWRAVHVHHDHPAAVKVITGEHARKERFVESFHREVRAVARLNHPNIIGVFDYGEVSGEIARISDGHLAEGSPYMVMELADSTLARVDLEQLNWPRVHTILVHILDALAHAHARGLIHRDLKPDNVLFMSDGDRGRLKLTDFGVAYAINTSRELRAEDDVITGTPRFMAPEQIRGRLRDQGPWTDLYALGCLVYWLTTGEHLFELESLDELLQRHLTEERPSLHTDMNVPQGFEQWTHRLVARNPKRRFQRAADAATSLAEIAGPPPVEDSVTVATTTSENDSVDVTIADVADATRLWEDSATVCAQFDDVAALAPRDHATNVELPETWREARHSDEPMEMLSVGLGLFELRDIPLVGRHRHRDVLWSNLADTCDTGRPHVVILEGPAGIGKTRQADWLAHRAHEVGAAEILTARHSPIGGNTDGLARMFANHLRCTGLPREKILSRVRDRYADGEGLDESGLHQCMALTDLLARSADPDFDETKQAIRFGSPEQRYIVWKRLLEKLARRRPVILLFDDVQWGPDTLQFARYLLEESRDEALPVLVVMTARPDLFDNNPLPETLLAEIAERPLVHRLTVEPLPDLRHRQLVENLLYLEPGLAARVAERTAGHPLFAIQLVGDWVERGLLELGEEGFCLATEEEPALPDDVKSLLRGRIERVVGQRADDSPGPALRSLEIGAVLGRDVDMREWQTICRRDGIEPPAGLLRRLSAQSLVHRTDHGWSFANGAVRETLEQIADDNGRLERHHNLCVRMLHTLYDASQPSLAPRLARHLLAAREYERALAPLVDAMEYHRRLGDYEQSKRWLRLHRAACRRLDLRADDRRYIEGPLTMVHTYLNAWEAQKARALLDECEPVCRAEGLDHHLARILWYRSQLARRDERFDKALELGHKALRGFRAQEDAEGIFHCLLTLGWWEQGADSGRRNSDDRPPQQMADEAERLARHLDDPYLIASALILRGAVAVNQGGHREAEDYFRRALELSHDSGFMSLVAHCHNDLGVIHNKMGDFDGAEEHYQRATDLKKRTGIGGWHVEQSNLGMIHLRRRDFQRAVPHLREALEEATRASDEARARVAQAGLSACMAAMERWQDFDRQLDESGVLEKLPHPSSGVAMVLEIAGEQAKHHGEFERARRVWNVALQQHRKLDDRERAAELEAQLASIDDSKSP